MTLSQIKNFDLKQSKLLQNKNSCTQLNNYPIGKKSIGKNWRNFQQVKEFFTDEIFSRQKFITDERIFYRQIFLKKLAEKYLYW